MPIALSNGIEIREFENRTFREVEYTISAKKQAHENEVRAKVMLEYQMVDLMAASVGRLLSKEIKFPKVEDIYPTLFEQGIDVSMKEKRQEAENELLALKWKQYAIGHNEALRKSKTEGEK